MRDLVNETFKRFQFEDVEKYMKMVNWCWNSTKTPPTIEKMKRVVLELIMCAIESEHIPSTTSTGGFEVSLTKRSGIPIDIEIKFRSQDDSLIIADIKTDISFMRKKKMKNLLNISE
jgi:hypothetical protein